MNYKLVLKQLHKSLLLLLMSRFVIVSDYPFTIEKSGYANQMSIFLPMLMDYFPEYEIIYIPIGFRMLNNNNSDNDNINIIDMKKLEKNNIVQNPYIDKVKVYSGNNNRKNLFRYLSELQNNLKLNTRDKILFYCDMIDYSRYTYCNLLPKKFFWYPCHTSFKDKHIDESLNQNDNLADSNSLNIFPIFNKIASFSLFGVSVMNSLGYSCKFINHSISSSFVNYNNKNGLRDKFCIDKNSFICLMIGRNNCSTDRKAFKENIEGFKLFKDKLQSTEKKVYLILHSIVEDSSLGGVNILEIIKKLDIEDDVIFIPNKFENCNVDYIKDLYNLSDVLLCNSKVEGFGLTSVEAQFCDLPVIVTDCTALAENLSYGIKTKPSYVSAVVNGYNSHSIPDPQEICKALLSVYNNNFEKKKINKNKYSIDYIFKDWVDFLELQDTNNIVQLFNEKTLFVLFDENNLLKNIGYITNIYNKYQILIFKKDDSLIYKQIESLKLPHVAFYKMPENIDLYNIYRTIFLVMPFYKYYFIVENLLISSKPLSMINDTIYFSSKDIIFTLPDIDIDSSKDISTYNELIFKNNKKCKLYTGNLLLSCQNYYKFLENFNNKLIQTSSLDFQKFVIGLYFLSCKNDCL